MTESSPRPGDAAVQFLISDFLEEILKFSESPGEMGQFLTRQLRELMGVRTVVLVEHGAPGPVGTPRIVALEPERARSEALIHGLAQLLSLQPELAVSTLFLRSSAPPAMGPILERLDISSLSMTPLRVGEQRVGTLFALNHLDLQRQDDVIRLLSALSPVFALILRNAIHFELQEMKALAQAEEYRALLRTNLDGYHVVGADGAVLDANEACLWMTGYLREELLALHISDLESLETRAETQAHAQKIKREGSDRFLSRYRRKDGTTFPVEVSVTYVPGQDIFIAFFRDLTEKEAAETALRQSELHHRELLDLLGEGVSIVDESETFLMANPAAERMFGVGPGELVGLSLRSFLDDEEWNQVTNHTSQRRQGKVGSYEQGIRRRDGQHRTLQVTAVPRYDARGNYLGSLAVTRDVTDEIKTKETLRLAQKMESLGNLAGGLAHDMNNVLGAILGLSTTHLDLEPEGTRLHDTFETITRACLRGRNVVKSLLDFARKDVAGERALSLNELLEDQARLLERTIPANITLGLELDPGADPILGDPDALGLMVMNLCVNAVDAMPDGGRLRLRTRGLPDGEVLLAVEDSGTGMSPEILEHALEPFFTTKPHGKGTGLGLSLVYSTVKAHHGQLNIQSRLGQGTLLEMRFRTVKADPGPAATGALETGPSRDSLHLLLVDDDELIHASVTALLEVMGHWVNGATSGEQALELVRGGLRPDLVILDMNMPGWGGPQTLPKLREILPQVPILLSTGRADQRAIDLARSHAGVTILAKPFSFRELQGAITALLPGA